MRSRTRLRPESRLSGSRLRWVDIPRSCLGVRRSFGVYLPPGYGTSSRSYPVLYLFRGAEREWAGRQDGREGLKSLLDRMISEKRIDPLLCVLPGFMETSGRTQGIPVDWVQDGSARGVGNGRMERHFFEVKHLVEQHFAVRLGRRHTALDGFSMGGFSSLYLGLKYPSLFASAGAYDGSFMWPGQIDPRQAPSGRACRLWFSPVCAPYFLRRQGWDIHRMERVNPINWVLNAKGNRLSQLRQLRIHIHAAGREDVGNLDRCVQMDAILQDAGINNTFRGHLAFEPQAAHTWRWADRHLEETLLEHDRVFKGIG